MKHLLMASTLVLIWSPVALTQTPAAAIDVMRLGPQVGQTVPDFRLQDQHGKQWTRDSLMGPRGLMLVFSRSADWCPCCKTQLIELQSRVQDVKARGLGLAVMACSASPGSGNVSELPKW